MLGNGKIIGNVPRFELGVGQNILEILNCFSFGLGNGVFSCFIKWVVFFKGKKKI